MPGKAKQVVCVPNVGASAQTVNGAEYLSTLSPRDKPWDRHRSEADQVEAVDATGAIRRDQRYGERVAACSQTLEFARRPPAKKKQLNFTLKHSWFCRVRHIPTCHGRRVLR